jgi:hypothetical protein
MRRTFGRAGLLCLFALLAAVRGLGAQATLLAELSVHAGDHDRLDVPVSAMLTGAALRLETGALRLYETTDGRNEPVGSQLRAGDPDRLSWILSGTTPAGAVRTFQLRAEPATGAGPQKRVAVADDGESLRVTVAGRPALEYRYALMPVPAGVREVFSLSGFIHPLWSPEGEVLTRIQPPDHYHHYGIWNPWTRTEFEGRTVDFWNVGSRQGRVIANGVVETIDGEVFGGFRSVHHHVDHRADGGDKVALREQWEVTVWNAGEGGWLIDFVSTLNPATDQPLTIKEYRYQGFSIRATERWHDSNSRLLTSEGLDKSNANATRARWIDVNGESDAQAGASGILFMTNPSNFNFPEQLRIWPTGQNRGVENVFINFNPAQDRDWELSPGRSYGLKYRMFVYDGAIRPEQAERFWRDYADPPRVVVQPSASARRGASEVP